ncbi:MAG: 16S rRNA (uracil(1498)-N(3))-methyltransferase [Candidatus Krumholzibacteriota bacterium]|nr:16S rRNA (uracil(1498)-N(3))-methyltransferase [Candidatus Krumholzibacteriota bacterium]
MSRTRRFFLPEALPDTGRLRLEGEEHRHLARVLRLRPGSEVAVVDGRGGLFEAVVDLIDRTGTELSVTRFERVPAPPAVDLALPLIRTSRLEIAVEKCAEIGVRWIVPYRASRVAWRGGEKEETRVRERIGRKLVAALKQSGGAWLPGVAPVADAAELAGQVGQYGAALLAGPGGVAPSEAVAGGIAVPAIGIVGPEGGFEPAEETLFREAGALRVSLGDSVLRAETAAICLLFLMHCAWR